MFLAINGKLVDNKQSYIIYFDSRFILLATTVLPAVVFRLEEKSRLFACLASTFVCLIFYDLIHNAFGVGYYQRGFDVISYYYINYITLISFFTIAFGVLTLKSISEKAERKALGLLLEKEGINNELLNRNTRLTQLNFEIEAQNEELQQQQEELSAGRDKLEEANQTISQQKDMLAMYNVQLQKLVEEKNKSLYLANEELIKHNNELRQFSYTVSHNLRGPVARLLGLSQLLEKDISAEEKAMVLGFINQSAIDLDTVLKDLNIIIDIRNDLYTIKEKILLQEECNKVISMLGANIKQDYLFHINFSDAPFAYAIRPMLHSILFNLISNAIKYQSPDRPLRVSLKSYLDVNQNTILELSDNGLGFDLARQKDNLFKLYKRFHTHVMGKGLGLFIVKTQLEIMGGEIELESQVNVGTRFRLSFPRPDESDRQVFFENEAAQLHYDAEINATIIVWKKSISSTEYRSVFEALLNTLKVYNTPCWISDLRQQGTVEEEDQLWFANKVVPEAVSNGLRRVATVGFKDPIRASYFEKMKARAASVGVDFFALDSLEAAVQIIKEYNVKV